MYNQIDSVMAADLMEGDVIALDTGYGTVKSVEDVEGDDQTLLVTFTDKFEDTQTEPYHAFRVVNLYMEVDDEEDS